MPRSSATALRFVSGAGYALQCFPSSGTIVTVTNNAAYQGLTALTVEAWIYPRSIPTYASGARIVNYFDGSNHGFEIAFNPIGGSQQTISGVVQNSSTAVTVTSPLLPLNVWTHVAMTWDGTTVRLFINGHLVATAALSGGNTGNPALNLTIGNVGATRAFDGYLSNVRIGNTCLYTVDFAPPVVPFFATTGTVGLWRLEEGYGATAFDYSATVNNGVLSGAPFPVWTPNAGPFAQSRSRNAPAGSAFEFAQNSNQQWTVTNAAALQGLTALTMEAWVKPYSIPRYASSARMLTYFTNPAGFGLFQNINTVGGGYGALFADIGNGTSIVAPSGAALALNRWQHIAASWDGATARLFLDGALQATAALVGGNTGNPSVNLLFGTSNGVRAFDGDMCEIRISKVARYTASFIPLLAPFVPDANTVGLWHCDEGKGVVLNDSSGNGLTAAYSGSPAKPRWVGGPFPITGGSMQRSLAAARPLVA